MTTAYSGTDNLEVMAEAINYNNYLIDIIAAGLGANDRVLDFGAGSGTFALPLVARGINVACMEPDDILRARLENARVKVHAGLHEIPARSFDYIYTFNVLEHIEDDQAALSDLADKLVSGGRLLIYVPAFEVLFSSMDRKVGHYRRYRRPQLEALIARSGLRVTDARYADSLGFLASLAYRMVDDDTGNLNLTAVKLYDRFAFPVSRFFDLFASRLFGKNLVMRAIKDS